MNDGEKNPDIKFEKEPVEQKKALTKEEIMFNIDENGKAIPMKIDVEVYDRVIDDEIMLTTMELDNALTMHESTKKALKATVKSMNDELVKLTKKLAADPKKKVELEKEIKDYEKTIKDLSFKNNIQINAFESKVRECRKDIQKLTSMIEEQKVIRKIEAIPCNVTESYKYFTKHMYKNDKGEWQNPENNEDTTWITMLLSENVIEPKLTATEWGFAKPSFRLSIKEEISSISGYSRTSPKEFLIEQRRGDKLKNIIGESQ